MKKVYLIATFVAIIAGVATYLFATQIEKNTKIKDAPMTTVVIAVVAMPENTTITADMVALRQYTTVSVVPGAATTLEEVIGKISRYPLVAGEQLVKDKLIKAGEDAKNAALSYQLKDGEYAYTIGVDEVQGVAGFISKGDYVDILHTGTVNDIVTTVILMKNIKVIRISNYTSNYAAEAAKGTPITSYSTITLLLTESQIVELTQMQTMGRIVLALKPVVTGQSATNAESNTTPVEKTTAPVNP